MNKGTRYLLPFVFFALLLAVWVSSSYAGYDASGLDRTLQKYVKDGRVDYPALRKDRKDLDAYAAGLRNLSHDEYFNLSNASKKAFWINAFNALCIKEVLDHYPCEAQTLFRFALFPRYSPQNVEGFFSKKRYRIVDEVYSLDLIQKLVLRIRMHEVKLLFATCPAARGGPKLRSSVYEGPYLKDQLEEQVKAVISDPKQFSIDRPNHAVQLSQFFDWFGEDFIPLLDRGFDKPTAAGKQRATPEFIMDYVSKDDAEFLKDPTVKVQYTKYDWTLNE